MQDLTGKKFRKWKVLKAGLARKNKHTYWKCKCKCGTIREVSATSLTSGGSTSCGCDRTYHTGNNHGNYKHGHSLTGKVASVYRVWLQIRARCTNPNHISYKNYKHLKICDRWKNFSNFIEDMGYPPKNYSIERIDNSKGYSPSNCKWATRKEQLRNTKRTHLITYKNKTLCLLDWAALLGINRSTLTNRLRKGWSVEEAFTQ